MRRVDRVMFQGVSQAVDRSAKYLLAWHAACEEDGSAVPNEVRAIYAEIRRLRSALGAKAEQASSPSGCTLDGVDIEVLVSCLLYTIDEIDRSLPKLRDERHGRAKRQRDGLGRLAIVFAQSPGRKLPVRQRIGRRESPTVRSVLCAINAKLAPSGGRTGEEFGMPRAFANASASGLPGSSGATPGADQTEGEWTVRDESVANLLQTELEHPRLRMIYRLDVEAYERALRAKDNRLALLHLASVLDAILIDYVLPRRRELGRATSPETWLVGELVEQLVGDVLAPAQMTFVELLVRARRLAYPGFQLSGRHAINATSVDQAVAVIEAIVAALAGRVATDPAPAASAADTPAAPEAPEAPAALKAPEIAPEIPPEAPVVSVASEAIETPSEPEASDIDEPWAPSPREDSCAAERYFAATELPDPDELSGLEFHLEPEPVRSTVEAVAPASSDVGAAGDCVSDRP